MTADTENWIPARLRELAAEHSLASGDVLFRNGARPAWVYRVLDGEIHLLRSSRAGGALALQRCRSGFLAEASIESLRYHCDAIAMAPSRLAAFPLTAFVHALGADPAFARNWRGMLAREVVRLRSQCERLALNTARERIAHLIETEGRGGEYRLRAPLKALAAELGLSHEALYRSLSAMQKTGEIQRSENLLRLAAARAPDRQA
jgi:CRP-like cAMP-binding protein